MNVNRSNERKWFYIKQEADDIQQKKMTKADYTDDLELLTITPAQEEKAKKKNKQKKTKLIFKSLSFIFNRIYMTRKNLGKVLLSSRLDDDNDGDDDEK